ncbi:hypothetical protein, partial [Corallococcus llansteffanensis]|uniref:hypothetical protein n=1 Tax=Corallococcus llansteffanensis TaxID=2316731 RepID=UPI001ABF97AC
PATSGREAPRESRLALAAVVCAVAFASFLGVMGPAARAPDGAGSRWDASATRAPCGQWARWEAGLLHASHVGAPVPASRDQLDPGGVGARPPTPFVPRMDSLRALLARYDARVQAQAQRLLAHALPPQLAPLADRPRTVNCPAQGPPARG